MNPRIVLPIWLVSSGLAFAVSPTPTATPKYVPPPPPTWFNGFEGFVGYHQLTPIEFRTDAKAHPNNAVWIQPVFRPYCDFSFFQEGWCYAYVMRWHVVAGIKKDELWRNRAVPDTSLIITYAQAVFDLCETHARELNLLQTGDLPKGGGPTPAAARRDLEGQLKVFIEHQYERLAIQMKELDDAVKGKNGKAKLIEMAATIRKKMDALPGPSSAFEAPPTNSPLPQTNAVPSVASPSPH